MATDKTITAPQARALVIKASVVTNRMKRIIDRTVRKEARKGNTVAIFNCNFTHRATAVETYCQELGYSTERLSEIRLQISW